MSTQNEPRAVITEWKIGARGPLSRVGGEASFMIADLEVSEILKAAESAIHAALKNENLSGDIATIELRIEFERRDQSTQTTITGHARLYSASQEPKP